MNYSPPRSGARGGDARGGGQKKKKKNYSQTRPRRASGKHPVKTRPAIRRFDDRRSPRVAGGDWLDHLPRSAPPTRVPGSTRRGSVGEMIIGRLYKDNRRNQKKRQTGNKPKPRTKPGTESDPARFARSPAESWIHPTTHPLFSL